VAERPDTLCYPTLCLGMARAESISHIAVLLY
jgi:hypothetical protein